MDDGEGVIDARFAEGAGAVVVGVMSGTSLDGLDLAAVRLRCDGQTGRWAYELLAAETVEYSRAWRGELEAAFAKTGDSLDEVDCRYGRLLGEEVRRFCGGAGVTPALVASHGHTVHHRPAEGYTRQIGDPATLRAVGGLPVVADFRSRDVALGGEGAPLVPLADRLLFGDYAQCLNLGGFANVSAEGAGGRLAYDITVANVLLNRLAEAAGKPFDRGGALARAGRVDEAIVRQLDRLPFYRKAPPKSLGREWVEAEVWPVFAQAGLAPRDGLATATEHVAAQLARALAAGPGGEILVTGGGARNAYLTERTAAPLGASHRLHVPEEAVVDFKEAIAFALLGALRVRGEANALASVTGARADSCGGAYVG